MKKLIPLISALLMLLTSCDIRKKDKISENNNAQADVKYDPTTVQVIDTVYDFGKVTDGEIVEYNYRFKNSGNKPLIVKNVSASCGCTVPEKPEEPIRPGETGFIKVKFNSAGRAGKAHKTITVNSNAEPEFPELLLQGEVMEKK